MSGDTEWIPIAKHLFPASVSVKYCMNQMFCFLFLMVITYWACTILQNYPMLKRNLAWGVILSFWCNHREASWLQLKCLIKLITLLFIKVLKEGNNWLKTLYRLCNSSILDVMESRGKLSVQPHHLPSKDNDYFSKLFWGVIKFWKSKTKLSLLQFWGVKKRFIFRATSVELAALQNTNSLSSKMRLLNW